MKEIKLNKLKESIYFDKCDNGLEIYMWVKEESNYYYATFSTRFGSIDTSFKVNNKKYNVNNGVAHFLEHISFNESNSSTPEEYYKNNGSAINAYTSYDATTYEVFGSNNILGDVKHLLDFVQDKYITNDLIEKERNIILEELSMDKTDMDKKMYYEVNKAIYHNNKKKYEITGTSNDINKINKQELELVYDTFYQPNNMFLVITGSFNPYEMSAMIKENQKSKKFKEISFKKEKINEEVSVNQKSVNITGNIEIPKISLVYKLNRKKFKEYNDFLLNVYLDLIISANFGPTSSLKEELMEKDLIYNLSYNIDIDENIIVIEFYSQTKYPMELLNILKDNISKITLSDERLKRRRKCLISDLITGLDDIEYVNNMIINDVIKNNKINNNIYNIYQELSLDESKRIIKRIDLNNYSTIIMYPQK